MNARTLRTSSELAATCLLALGLLATASIVRAQSEHAGHRMPTDTDPKPITDAKPATPRAHAGHDAADREVPDDPTEPMKDAAHSPPHDTHAVPAMGHDAHAGGHEAMDTAAAPTQPIEPIPEVTDADRAAAFPPVHGHTAHDDEVHTFFLLDRFEAWNADSGTGTEWEGQGWIGTDLDRFWYRSEGEREGGVTEAVDLELFYGRAIAAWWDLLVGVRHDFKPGDGQTFLAVGVLGFAPYKFEIEATAYVGESGQTAARIEAEYDTWLAPKLILQSLVELDAHGRSDPARGIGAGISTVEVGFRLRYEITRQFAPYIGVVHERAFGSTADFRRADGESTSDTRLVAGLRVWF